MYTGGEGSSKEKKKRNTKAAEAGGKAHTIKGRTKQVSNFVVQQAKDAGLAAILMMILHAAIIPLSLKGQILTTILVFAGKKLVNVAGRTYGKKHTIKNRKIGSKDITKAATMVGLPLSAVLILGVSTPTLMATGIGALAATISLIKRLVKKSEKTR